MLSSHIAAVLALTYTASASLLAAPTVKVEYNEAVVDPAFPLPTQAPLHALFKRAVSSTCGYIGGNVSDPLECGKGSYCGFAADLKAFGCCDTSSVGSNGQTTLGDCDQQTTCYDSTASSKCNAACQTNTLVALCTDKAAPYCLAYTATGFSGIYKGFDCTDRPSLTLALYATPTAMMNQNTAAGSSSSSKASAGSISSKASGTAAAVSSASGSALSQGGAGASAASSTRSAAGERAAGSTAAGALVLLIAIAVLFSL